MPTFDVSWDKKIRENEEPFSQEVKENNKMPNTRQVIVKNIHELSL